MAVSGMALASVAVGSVFAYAGIKGFSVPEAFQAIVTGKSPATLKQKLPVDSPVDLPTGGGNPTVGGGSATGQAIANDALKYQGQGYNWGGRADKPGNWDCSSFVSYVLGHDLNMGLPGGKWGAAGFPPNEHGPTTTEYQGFGTAITRAQVQAGDLVVWDAHVGIAINNTTMISARTSTTGTGTSAIDDDTRYFGAEPHCRRVATG